MNNIKGASARLNTRSVTIIKLLFVNASLMNSKLTMPASSQYTANHTNAWYFISRFIINTTKGMKNETAAMAAII